MSAFQLAWSNLTHQRFRTLISLIGVGFAVLLVFMQLGFREAVSLTATLLYEDLNFDLLLTSSEYGYLARSGAFSRDRLAQAQSIPGVRAVLPATAALGLWRDPQPGPEKPRPQWSILTLAIEPNRVEELFRYPVGVFSTQAEMAREARLLDRVGTVLIDHSSRPEYGDPQTWTPAARNELNGQPVQVAGTFFIGTGFGYNGLLLASEETLQRCGWPSGQVSFGLIQLSPGANRATVQRELQRSLPGDVKVFTRGEIIWHEQNYWLTSTPVGQFFTAGVIIALLVGAIFVYQMMASDIAKNIAEYATILAMGYPGKFLSRVVYAQGMLLGIVGFVPGFVVTLGCYAFITWRAGLPIAMTTQRLVVVFVLTLMMCMGSAAAAVRVVHRANPADLF